MGFNLPETLYSSAVPTYVPASFNALSISSTEIKSES
jgi:hypothetical protein